MSDEVFQNQYSKEFQLYMEYALEQYLIKHRSFSQAEAKLKIAQEYDEVLRQAKEDKFL